MLYTYHIRTISSKIKELAKIYPVILVVGPRQAGKTELVRHLFPQYQWVLLDPPSVALRAQDDPELFLTDHRRPLILDEVQKAPQLFGSIKAIVDREKPEPATFILTGSQPFALMKNISETLAGRIGIAELHPMTPDEAFSEKRTARGFASWINEPPIGSDFPWKYSPLERLLRGGFPAMALSAHSPTIEIAAQRLRDYILTYVTRDLREFSNVKDLGRFEIFLRALALQSGRLLNLSTISREQGVPHSTTQDWLALLEASFLYTRIPPFHRRLDKRDRKTPKGVVCDSGLQLSLLSYQTVEQIRQAPILGASFETAVINAVRSLLSCGEVKYPLYHWRFEQREEVDLLVELTDGKLIPVEIKFTSAPTAEDASGIAAFQKRMKKGWFGVVISTNTKCFMLRPDILHIPFSAL